VVGGKQCDGGVDQGRRMAFYADSTMSRTILLASIFCVWNVIDGWGVKILSARHGGGG